jgi:hypothetical protein
MAKKIKLDLPFENDSILVGINSHLKDYRIVWLLNKQLGLRFSKTDDFIFRTTKPKRETGFSCFYYRDEINLCTWFLLSNLSLTDNLNLITEQKQADYIMIFDRPAQNNNTRSFIAEIKKISNILTAYEINLTEIKYLTNILTDLELHILTIEKRKKENRRSPSFL